MASTGRMAPLFGSVSAGRAAISAFAVLMDRSAFSLASTISSGLAEDRSLTRIEFHTTGNEDQLPGTSVPGPATPTIVTVRPGLSSKLLPSTSSVPPNRLRHRS